MTRAPKYFMRMPHGMTLDVDQTGFPALTALEAAIATVMLNRNLEFVQVERLDKKDVYPVIFTVRPGEDNHVGLELSANKPTEHEKLAYQLAGRGWAYKDVSVIDVIQGDAK